MTVNKDYFKTFCTISKAFGSTLKRDALLDLIVGSAIEAMEAKAASLFLEDKQKGVFVSVCQKGLSDSYLHSDPYRVQKMSDEMVKTGTSPLRTWRAMIGFSTARPRSTRGSPRFWLFP